jgi:hypothetical protein
MGMKALQKDKPKAPVKEPKAPVKPTGKWPSAVELIERVTKRWPKVMARLGE